MSKVPPADAVQDVCLEVDSTSRHKSGQEEVEALQGGGARAHLKIAVLHSPSACCLSRCRAAHQEGLGYR